MKHPRSTIRDGFTLVELLVATALTTVLMMTVLKVTASIGSHQALFESHAASGSWGKDVIALVTWDLSHATHFEVQEHQVVLTGHSSLDPTTLEPTHRPVRVIYRVTTLGETSWLIREQQDLLSLTNQHLSRQLILQGVQQFSLIPFDPHPPQDTQEPAVTAPQQDPARVPDQVKLSLQSQRENQSSLHTIIVVK